MPGSPSSSASPSGHARDGGGPDSAEPAGSLSRPVVPAPLATRFGALMARVPISPLRLLVLAGGGVAALLAGLWLLRPPPPAVESTLPRAQVAPAAVATTGGGAATPSSTTHPWVVVDAAGAVLRPGVYRLRTGARVDDLVRAAGGLAAGADRDRLNLAAPLADGQRVFVPRIGETSPPPVDPSGGSDPSMTTVTGGSSPPGGTADPIDLNTATQEQLEALPGVGPATAAAILAYRTEHGRFRSVDELLEVRGIGDAKLAAVRARVRV